MASTQITSNPLDWPDQLEEIIDRYGTLLTSIEIIRSRDGSSIMAIVNYDGVIADDQLSPRQARLAELEARVRQAEVDRDAAQRRADTLQAEVDANRDQLRDAQQRALDAEAQRDSHANDLVRLQAELHDAHERAATSTQ